MQRFLALFCLFATALTSQFFERGFNRPLEVEIPNTPCLKKQSEDLFKCSDMIGCKITQCDPDGSFSPMQCHPSTGYCFCVDLDGNEIEGTHRSPSDERGPPDCSAAREGADLSDNSIPEVVAVLNKREAVEPLPQQCTQNSDCPFRGLCGPTGQCSCPQICPFVYSPVCGNDGKTYSNECELNVRACQNQVEINVAYREPCELKAPRPDTTCNELECFGQGQQCVESNGRAECACTSVCADMFEPVCGDNGKTYPNACELDVAACKAQTHIEVTKSGSCEDTGIDE